MKKITVITGHYGSGKTNLAVNLAVNATQEGRSVTVVDLDIVNPYFRTADFRQLFEEKGIRLIAPDYANSNLDIPSLQ
ncbi:MAG: P-loop NTPase, partial [Ruminococcus sp.]|nr:P-loop NTPase [Ruminococcus sp.]